MRQLLVVGGDVAVQPEAQKVRLDMSEKYQLLSRKILLNSSANNTVTIHEPDKQIPTV